jgi:hypothetical protein
MVVNPQKVSNIFNSMFLENVNKTDSRKVPSTVDWNNTSTIMNDSLYLPEVTVVDLLNIIHSMRNKKSTRLNGISAFLPERYASYTRAFALDYKCINKNSSFPFLP